MIAENGGDGPAKLSGQLCRSLDVLQIVRDEITGDDRQVIRRLIHPLDHFPQIRHRHVTRMKIAQMQDSKVLKRRGRFGSGILISRYSVLNGAMNRA